LDRLVGANIVLVPPLSYEGKTSELGYVAGLKDKMIAYADKIRYIDAHIMYWYINLQLQFLGLQFQFSRIG